MTKHDIKTAYDSVFLSEGKIDEMEKRLLDKMKHSNADTGVQDEEHGKNYSIPAKKRSIKPAIAAISAAAVVALGVIGGSHIIGRNAQIPIDSGVSQTDTSDSTTSGDSTSQIDIPPVSTPDTLPEKGAYDSVFVEIAEENPSSGPETTYEDAMLMISDPSLGGIDSFYVVETVRPLTVQECEKLEGWELWFKRNYVMDYDESNAKDLTYLTEDVIYEVRLVEDLLSGEKCDKTIYLAVSIGNPEYQTEGDPPYSAGERFTAAILQNRIECDIMQSRWDFMLRYDVVTENGIAMAYSRGNTAIDGLKLDGAEDISEKVVTSTTENPAVYTQKLPLESLSEFLRKDWRERRLSRHFETKPEQPTEYTLNMDVISELGLTYQQLCEKYDAPIGGHANTCTFNNGYGRYTWKSLNGGDAYADLNDMGGCNMIQDVNSTELFAGVEFPISFEEFSKMSGFVFANADTEPSEIDNSYYAEMIHPDYKGLTIYLSTIDYATIEFDTFFTLTLDADCLDAKPVVEWNNGSTALEILGASVDENGRATFSMDTWMQTEDYIFFRDYFFGTWECSGTSYVINDAIGSSLAQQTVFSFGDFYIVNDDVIAFNIHGNAESKLYWMNIDNPGLMYVAPYNGDVFYNYEKTKEIAVFTKTAPPPTVAPKNGFLSVFKLREMARDYGIDLSLITDIEYLPEDGTETLWHDTREQAYPMFLVKEAENKIVLSTQVGNVMTELDEIKVTITLEKTNGEWTRSLDFRDTPITDYISCEREFDGYKLVAIIEYEPTVDGYYAITKDEIYIADKNGNKLCEPMAVNHPLAIASPKGKRVQEINFIVFDVLEFDSGRMFAIKIPYNGATGLVLYHFDESSINCADPSFFPLIVGDIEVNGDTFTVNEVETPNSTPVTKTYKFDFYKKELTQITE